MSEETTHDRNEQQCARHGFSRRTRLGIAAAALIGLGAVLGGLAAVSATAGAHMFRGHDAHGAQAMAERVRDRAAWMLGKLDATPQQEARVEAIITALVTELAPLGEQHREHRRALVSELLRSDVDPERLEDIRREELRLADLASARVLDAVVQTSAVLTAQQREELMEAVTRHGR